MLYRYTFSIVFMVLSLSDAHAERSLARVIDVQRGEVDSVVLDAGRLDGLSEGAQVTLLREVKLLSTRSVVRFWESLRSRWAWSKCKRCKIIVPRRYSSRVIQRPVLVTWPNTRK